MAISRDTNVDTASRKAPSRSSIYAGILIAALTAAAAYQLRQLPWLALFSPMIIAVVIGIAFANIVGTPAHAQPGIKFCQKTLLRLAIALLGFQITLDQFATIGLSGIVVIVGVLIATFLFTMRLGRLLGVERDLSCLIAAGTSICGASAIVAADAVVRAKDEDVAYSVACITLFGTIAMLALPLIGFATGMSEQVFGLWVGASIHEVAQVVGAAFQFGQFSGEIGTISKLVRVAMLAPVIIALGIFIGQGAKAQTAGSAGSGIVIPWFAVFFVAAAIINSVLDILPEIRQTTAVVTTVLLSVGLAAMGLQTNVSAIREKGLRPLLLGLFAFVFIAASSLALIVLTA